MCDVNIIEQEQILTLDAVDNGHKTLYFVYHGGCTDGFTAAYFMTQAFKKQKEFRFLHLMPEQHRSWPMTQKLLGQEIKGAVIYADICPPRELLLQLKQHVPELDVYDHHESAQKQCGDLPYCHFDMTRSGCGIIYDTFLYGGRTLFCNVVEAGDLWKHDRIQNCREILSALWMRKKTLENWGAFDKALEHPETRAAIINEGAAYRRYEQRLIGTLTGGRVHKLKIDGVLMPAANTSVLVSEVGSILASKIGPCAAVWVFDGQKFKISLRSVPGGTNVATIAEKYGGGGHPRAAAFTIDSMKEFHEKLELQSYSDEDLELVLVALGL